MRLSVAALGERGLVKFLDGVLTVMPMHDAEVLV